MATDIIARGMASVADSKAQQALDELAMIIEGTMNADETVFTDLEGNVVTPNDYSVYHDITTYVFYRWNGTGYYTVADPRGVVRYTEQSPTEEEKAQARTNIGAQSVLESGVNIKTVNGESLLGSGNVNIRTEMAFDPSWPTNDTVLALAQAINADPNTGVGKVYLGEIRCSDMPFEGNAELKVEILNQIDSQKIMLCTLTSSNVFPYHWEATYWSSGLTQWRSFSEEAVLYRAQNLTTVQQQQARSNIGAGVSNFSGDYQDLSNKPDLSIYAQTANLATVATTGNYSDLNGGPTFTPEVIDGDNE